MSVVLNFFSGDPLVTPSKLLEDMSTRNDIKDVLIVTKHADDTYDVCYSRMTYADLIVMTAVAESVAASVAKKLVNEG